MTSAEYRELMLELENAIADKQWIICCGNNDIAAYGSWQCNWAEAYGQTEKEYQILLKKLNDYRRNCEKI